MFFLVGLGLGDAKDITVRGLEIVKRCDKVLLESYTSILTVGQDVLVNWAIFILYIHFIYGAVNVCFCKILGEILWSGSNSSRPRTVWKQYRRNFAWSS